MWIDLVWLWFGSAVCCVCCGSVVVCGFGDFR